MDTIWQDIRFGLRTLAKSPGFTLAAALSLALGIGVNTTIFTLVSAVFLNPLPVERAAELVGVFTIDERNANQFTNLLQTSRPNFLDYRDKNQAFTGLAAYLPLVPASLSLGSEPQQVTTEMVTGDYFDVLGVRPTRGRFFRAEDDRKPGASPVAVLSYGLWQRRFGGMPDTLGRSFDLNGTPVTIVGVAPEGFKVVNALVGPDLWVPSMLYQTVLPVQFRQWFDDRRALLFSIVGRLRPGVTIDQAEAHLKTVAGALEREYPLPNSGRSIALRPLAQVTIFPGLRDALVLGAMGQEDSEKQSGILTLTNEVDPGYFTTTETTFRAGRDFTDADREGSILVAIVNDAFVRRFFPNEAPIGRRFRSYGDTSYREIVGVVETVKYQTVGEPPQPCVFVPLAQNYSDTMTLHVRATGEAASVIGLARSETRAIDALMPITQTSTVEELIDLSLWAPKFAASLLGIFGLLALVLASVGLYGVMAYSVGQRQREIGVRLALGADQPQVLRQVLTEGLTLVAAGVAFGLLAAFLISRAVASLLYDVSATDPASFLGAAGVLIGVAAAASYLPALRASRVDPIVALRSS